jgi:hypothetical protein
MPMPNEKVHINRSSFTQSGWKSLESGETHVFFNGDQPKDVSKFEKVWEQLVEEVRTVTKIELE